jgi:hypothetical protein
MARRYLDMGLVESDQMNNRTDIKNRVYILRLWRTESPDLSWRASLENPRTGERIGFACLEQLFAFLIERVERDAKGGKME